MAAQTQEAVLIKRYGAARLYDTHAARYVTLGDIADMVREQHRIAIHDAGTGEDITQAVLARLADRRH